MNEILPGVFHWTILWPDRFPLESYWLRTPAGSVVIDPIESSGLGAIEDARDVRAVIITDAWHERSARLFAKRTQAPIYVPADDVPNIDDLDSFHTYADGERLPCDLIAISVPAVRPASRRCSHRCTAARFLSATRSARPPSGLLPAKRWALTRPAIALHANRWRSCSITSSRTSCPATAR